MFDINIFSNHVRKIINNLILFIFKDNKLSQFLDIDIHLFLKS